MARRPATVDFHGLLTAAPRMLRLFDQVRRVAASDAPVLVRGQTGTGKERVARAIHDLGARRDAPFRAVNCATFTPELLASELFGHVRGAFTGAVRDRPGLFQAAHTGTLFLDEVAEIPLDVQARLLRVVQEQSFVPLGATDPVQVDVRIVSATHRALRHEVEAGRFREDLMYRLRVVPLFLPRLVDREGDVELLATHFLAQGVARGGRPVEGFTEDAMALLRAWHWPGNVRELRNVVEYALVMGEGPRIRPEDLTPELRGEAPPDDGERPTLASSERDRILEALRVHGGRKAEAAAQLGISRSTLWRRIRELGL
jgi:two-component system, NtrC family, response regulator AtoC